MSLFNKIVRGKRRITFSVSILLLLATFLVGFYYYYIPSNKENLNRYAFLILENIKTNIRGTSRDLQKLYQSTVEESCKENEKIEYEIKESKLENVKGKELKAQSGKAQKGADSCDLPEGDSTQVNGRLEEINSADLVFLFRCKSECIQISTSSRERLAPLLQIHNKELFQSFLLLEIKDSKAISIYKNPTLNIGRDIKIDSLLPNGKGDLFAGIRDIHIEDLDYKMFYIPFTLDNHQLLLCGFVKASDYNSKSHQIPVSFIYPIVILLLLLIIALPILKIYIMDPAEEMKLGDLIGFTLSLFVGSTLITLVIIQLILLKDGDIRAENDLDSLSGQIDSSFSGEVLQAYHQLDVLDSLMNENLKNLSQKSPKKSLDVSVIVRKYLDSNKQSPSVYYNFDRVVWIDSGGQQIIKGQLDSSRPLYPKVRGRKYFESFKCNEAYFLPNNPDSIFALEPVFSWTNGEFRIIFSRRSRLKTAFVAGLSTQMYSVTNTIMSAGFGFCIIDRDGNVQVHSDMNRNLKENFLDQAESSTQIKEAIASRQQMFFGDIRFYGKNHALHIKPISNLPFFLVTFYDKGYILPFNMRILIFSLLFCLVSYGISVLIWLLVYRKRYYNNPLLHSPMDFFRWFIPKKSSSLFYIRSIVFLLIYIISLLLITFGSNFKSIGSNYLVLFIILLTPINLMNGLMVLLYWGYENDAKEPSWRWLGKFRRAKLAILSMLIISSIVVIYTKTLQQKFSASFLIFQATLIFGLGIYCLVKSKNSVFLSRFAPGYLTQYAVLVWLLIICFAILPASIYTWYSNNQEIMQSVKKQQLFIAEALHARRNRIHQVASIHAQSTLPAGVFDILQYGRGIYTIYHDRIGLNKKNNVDSLPQKSFDDFYFDIANQISNNYYDPQSYPALKDSADDHSWFWFPPEQDSLSFWYAMQADLLDTGYSKRPQRAFIQINSLLPDRYIYLSSARKSYLIILLCGFLLWGLYKLIRAVAERIFLQKFIKTANIPLSVEVKQNYIEEFKANYIAEELRIKKLADLENEYDRYSMAFSKEESNRYEMEIINSVEEFREFYHYIWQKCSEKERCLLVDLAKDGLMNFKNTAEIYLLIRKGVLIIHKDEVKLLSASFRAYILENMPALQVDQLMIAHQKNGAWQSFRTPLLVILLSVAAFIFFTQEQIWQRIMALLAGFTTSLPLLMNIFSSGTGAPKQNK
jgi:hypothetical protein